MNNTLLENYVKENILILKEENKDITWGQLKKDLKKFASLKKGAEVSKAVSGFIPYVGGAQDLYGVIKGLTNIPDSKRSTHFLSKFDIDDQIAAIVDNKLEKKFIDSVVKEIEEKNENEVIRDFNMTDMLNKFLNDEFDNRGITGYQE